MQGAGGIGGLLSRTRSAGNTEFYFYDANGNVAQLVDTNGAKTATYEYDPFGRLRSSSGDNPFKFSTKYFDDESELAYYGYRYYSPEMGRFVSRDPIGERGGEHLSRFVDNNPITYFDPHGLFLQQLLVQWLLGKGITLGTSGLTETMVWLRGPYVWTKHKRKCPAGCKLVMFRSVADVYYEWEKASIITFKRLRARRWIPWLPVSIETENVIAAELNEYFHCCCKEKIFFWERTNEQIIPGWSSSETESKVERGIRYLFSYTKEQRIKRRTIRQEPCEVPCADGAYYQETTVRGF